MKPFVTDRGPHTQARPYLTSLGGVYAFPTNPVAWGVDPCLGCFPWPNKYSDEEAAYQEEEEGPPPSAWNPSGPAAPFVDTQGSLTSGGGGGFAPAGAAPAAPAATPAPTTAPAGSTTAYPRQRGWG